MKYILGILLIAVVGRVVLFLCMPNHLANPWDSVSYGEYALKVMNAQGFDDILNPIRPPLYSILVAGSFTFGNVSKDIPYHSIFPALNDNGGVFLVLLQSVLGIVSSVCFYIVLSQLVRPFISFMTSILFAIHPLVLPWERIVLTESFSISFLIFYICAFFYFFKHPTMIRGLFVVGLAVLLTWLRSVYVVLLPLTLLLFFLHKRQVKIFPQIYLLCGIFFIPILFHMFVNYRYHNMFTLQVMGPINMFGRLLVHPYPIPDIPDNRISEWMKANYVPDTYENPFPILESLSKDVYFYFDIDLLHDIRVYNATVIRQNIVPFLIDVARDIPKAYEVNSSIRLSNIRSIFLFQQFSVAFMVFCSFVLFAFPYIVIKYIRHSSTLLSLTVFSGFFSIIFLFLGVLYGYIESSRYILSAFPFLFLYVGGFFEIVTNTFKHDTNRRR